MDKDKAIRKRIAAKSWLTKASKNIEEILENEDRSEAMLVDVIEQFEQRLLKFDEAQEAVEQFSELEELENDIEASAVFRDNARKNLIKARKCLSDLVKEDLPTPSNSNQNNWKGANLPKLQLPHFNGDILEFQSFWDKFTALIDNRSDLSNVDKFSYLQSVLRGEAKSCLEGLALTDANYDSARDILLRRFGRNEKIIVAHIQKLLNISSQESMWKIYDQVQVHVRSLANLGVSGEKYGLVLTPMILHRLPASVRLEWARSSEGKEGDVEHLLSFLFDEIERRERSSQISNIDSTAADRDPRFHRHRRPTGSALMTIEEPSSGRNTKSCHICRANHYSDKCPEIVNLAHEQRKEKIKSMKLCFKCLSSAHRAAQCNRMCFFCKGPHHSVLHRREADASASTESRLLTGPGFSSTSQVGLTGSNGGSNDVSGSSVEASPNPSNVSGGAYYSQTSASGKATLMQVATIVVDGQPVTVLFDSGSDFSYIRQDTAKRLGLKDNGKTTGLISAFSGSLVEEEHFIYEMPLGGIKTTLLSLKTIAKPLFRPPVPPQVLEPFRDLPISNDLLNEKIVKIDVLIGLDFYHEFMYPEQIIKNGLVAQRTALGWMISGSYPSLNVNQYRMQTSLLCSNEPSEATIRKLWELSSIGILGEGQPEHDPQSRVFENFAKGVSFNDQRYCVGLPWKDDDIKENLMNNESSTHKRLVALDRKLSRDPDLKGKYQEVFTDLENKGIIEEVPNLNSDDTQTQNPIFYLPHRPVVKSESQTTKIRPVFDASAKGDNGVSLNDCVEVGPKMIPDLMQILLRFRRWTYGLSGDIQKAFLQIELNETDRDVHRFLLFDADNQVRHMRFKRVTFGVASSPFMLNATVKLHLSKFEKDNTVKELETNMYVDDWLTGSDSEEELSEMMMKSTEIMLLGGFPLTKWISNSPQVKECLQRSFDYQQDNAVGQSQKVLGLGWKPTEDVFHFDTCKPMKKHVDEVYTKRTLLALIAKQFDPLGLLSPYTISLKILFQEVWKLGLEWDEILPSEIQEEINTWVEGLTEIGNWQIPRRLTGLGWKKVSAKELVVYVDASEKAYGACIYLVSRADNDVQQRLVTAKVRVAPLKRVTLPRLELLAALLGARLLKFVKVALELPEDTPYTCWTDSTITLAWIQGESSRWKQFIRNRVEEIQSLTNPSNWKHCPGKENPADLLTRGVKASVLTHSTLWLRGPEVETETLQTPEKQSSFSVVEMGELVVSEGTQPITICSAAPESSSLIEYKNFSSFGKLLRVIALVLKFVERMKATRRPIVQGTWSDKLIQARGLVIRDLQRRHYDQEIHALRENGRVSRHSSLLPLSPFLDDDGLIRIHGRLEKAAGLTYDERHPVILPRCHATLLLVRSQHILLKHAGVGTLINSLRCQYWILGVRCLAKRVVKECVQCRRFDSRPMDQVRAPLPHDRVTRAPPFSVTGIDHAGPLFCNDTGEKKFYIVLFTCAVTRALHLELVDSLNLDDFILAFRRFVSRRTLPSIIYSDNARTFKSASATLQARLGKEVVCWKTICPLSPNWGGWWERLVRSVKSALKKSLGKDSISKKELDTLLPEIEACVNSRPLMYISQLGHVLTPSHFLIGRGTPLTSSELENFENVVKLSERYEFEETLTESFWEVWKNEYLRNLPPVTAKNSKTNCSLEVGSLVLIRDQNKPRMQWALGRVEKLYKGIDEKIRAVQLRTQKGLLVRSIQHLSLMEDRDSDPIDNQIEDKSITEHADELQEKDQVQLVNRNTVQDSNPVLTRRGRAIKPRTILDL